MLSPRTQPQSPRNSFSLCCTLRICRCCPLPRNAAYCSNAADTIHYGKHSTRRAMHDPCCGFFTRPGTRRLLALTGIELSNRPSAISQHNLSLAFFPDQALFGKQKIFQARGSRHGLLPCSRLVNHSLAWCRTGLYTL